MAKAKEKPDTATRVKVKGHTIAIDITKLESREVIELEEYFDKPFAQILNEGWLDSTKGGVFLIYQAYRKAVDPRVSFEDILDLKPDELEYLERDPKRPTGTPGTSGKKGSGKSSASDRGKSTDSDPES
jgi:hypothetical protein